MGPSGCGKTTLLNALAQKLSPALVAGRVLIAGRRVGKAQRRRIGFVFQDDLMLSNLTVAQTVRVSAELKLPPSLPAESKAARVDALMDILGLRRVAHQVRAYCACCACCCACRWVFADDRLPDALSRWRTLLQGAGGLLPLAVCK